ncbi:MAG: uroporphyrinogen-III C-methyltransferase [Caldimonas sp.]
MNEAAPPAADSQTPVVLPAAVERSGTRTDRRLAHVRRAWVVAAVALLLALVGVGLAWKADQRVRSIEQELVRRQQDSAGQSAEAKMFAKQAQEGARDAAAKVALLEARVAEVALQRSQLEELMQSLSRSRDENLLVDVDAAIRVAMQQTAITGSAEPLVASLKQIDERLARYNQPRLEGVRRSIARDLDRVKTASVADISTLTIKLDEAIRMVDELPLLGEAQPYADRSRAAASAPRAPASAAARAASAASAPSGHWARDVNDATARLLGRAWDEVRSLIRVTRIDHPDAMLLAPDQAFFLKENLKLRLLNARLALLSRQFDTAQGDLQSAQASLERYFDRSSRRTVLAAELLRQVAGQARQGGEQRPDDTLAALAAAAAGR